MLLLLRAPRVARWCPCQSAPHFPGRKRRLPSATGRFDGKHHRTAKKPSLSSACSCQAFGRGACRRRGAMASTSMCIAPIARDIATAVADHGARKSASSSAAGNIYRGSDGGSRRHEIAHAPTIWACLATVMNGACPSDRARASEGRCGARAIGDPHAHCVRGRISATRPWTISLKGRVVVFAGGTGNPYLHHRYGSCA